LGALKPAFAARFRTLSTAILAGYWLAMFGGTHWPNFSLPGYPQNTDKVLHFSAYAGLSFLIAVRVSLKRDLRLSDGLWILAVIVGYSIFDEVSQPPFGRTCDFYDAVADWVGGVFGLGVFLAVHRVWRRTAVGRHP
jgi:VanZ family protein